jgi:hypothetical protein
LDIAGLSLFMSLFYVVIYFLKYGQNEQWNMKNNGIWRIMNRTKNMYENNKLTDIKREECVFVFLSWRLFDVSVDLEL